MFLNEIRIQISLDLLRVIGTDLLCEKLKNSNLNLNSDQRIMKGSIPYFVRTRRQLQLPRHAQTQLWARSQKCKFELGAVFNAVVQ